MSSTNLDPLPEVRQSNHELGLFSLQDYERGATIINCNPPSWFMALNHSNSLSTTCYSCLQRTGSEQSVQCRGCRFVRFCSEQCAATDKMRHAAECSSFAGLNLTMSPNLRQSGVTEILAVLRMICLKDAGLIDTFWNGVTALHANYASNYGANKRLKYELAAHAIRSVSQTVIDLAVIRRLFYVINTNAFPLWANDNTIIGFQIFPLLSRANHSCIPNLAYTAQMQRIVATKSIKSGDELTTSYVNLSSGVLERRQKLKDEYFFDCECERCRSELQTIAAQEAQSGEVD